jgi:hypothetical protein
MALLHSFPKNFSMKKLLLLLALLLGAEEAVCASVGMHLAKAVGVGCAGAVVAYGTYVIYKKFVAKDYDRVELLPWLRREYMRIGQSRVLSCVALWGAATLGQLPIYEMPLPIFFMFGALSEVLSIAGWNSVDTLWTTWRFHQRGDDSAWWKIEPERRGMIDTVITKIIPATGRILMTALLVSYILYRRMHMPYTMGIV